MRIRVQCFGLLLLLSPLHLAAAVIDGEELVDPTAPIDTGGNMLPADATQQISNAGSLHLSSVLIREDRRIAVINSQRVVVGDQVGSALVLSIEPDKVTVESGGEVRELYLHQRTIKQPNENEG